MKAYESFVFCVMAPIVLGSGLFGNIIAIVVFFKGKLNKIGPVLIYKLMFICDTFYIIQILVYYFQYPFYLDLTILSREACKIFYYFQNQGDTITPILHMKFFQCISQSSFR